MKPAKKRVQKPKEETQGFPTVPVPLANSLATQRTVDLKFGFWIFSGFTWFATQLTHIHRFMYCGMLSKLTKLSMLSKAIITDSDSRVDFQTHRSP